MNDYERVASVIRHLDETHAEQPDLASLAARAGLSPSHFHRLFSAWASITPKDFVQCLTLEYAKERLSEGRSVLDAALESGLSGPGRLHDLCVSLEAASPGEWKSAGAGWTITAGFAETPFGCCLIAESPRGICHLSFLDPEHRRGEMDALRKGWAGAEIVESDGSAENLASRIFQRSPGAGLRAYVRGTAFQIRVWRALMEIPPGALVTYGRLAALAENPRAVRATGTAVGRNPVAFLIPCHRVIRETGIIGGYRWGRDRKRAILAWEHSKATP